MRGWQICRPAPGWSRALDGIRGIPAPPTQDGLRLRDDREAALVDLMAATAATPTTGSSSQS